MGQPQLISKIINPELILEAEKILTQNLTTSQPKNAKVVDLPNRFREYGFKDLIISKENEALVELCKKYFNYETEKKSLVLCGNVGAGKTRLAVAILRNLVALPHPFSSDGWRKSSSIFLIADEFFQKLNDVVRQSSKLDLINRFLMHDVCCLDDLSIENFTPAKQENLYLLINRAYVDDKRLIITTNFTMEQLKEIDPRIADRLKEMAHILLFKGKSFRK